MPNFDLLEYGGYGQAKLDQLETLKKLCKMVGGNAQIAEIGSWTGLTTSVFGIYVAEFGGLVSAIDWFKGSPNTSLTELASKCDVLSVFKQNMAEHGLTEYIDIYKMKSEEAALRFGDNSLSLVFIDGDHRYEAVKQDIELWYPKVKRGGILCGHDCEKRISEVDVNVLTEHKDKDWFIDMHPGVILAVGEKFPKCEIENDIWWVRK